MWYSKNLWAWPNSAFPEPSTSKVLSVDKVLGGTGNQLASSDLGTDLAILNPASHYMLSRSFQPPFQHVFLGEAWEKLWSICQMQPMTNCVECGDQRGLVDSFWFLRMLLLVWMTLMSFGELEKQDGAGVNLLPSELQGESDHKIFFFTWPGTAKGLGSSLSSSLIPRPFIFHNIFRIGTLA